MFTFFPNFYLIINFDTSVSISNIFWSGHRGFLFICFFFIQKATPLYFKLILNFNKNKIPMISIQTNIYVKVSLCFVLRLFNEKINLRSESEIVEWYWLISVQCHFMFVNNWPQLCCALPLFPFPPGPDEIHIYST